MKNLLPAALLLLTVGCLLPTFLFAQTDSVIVTGRIRNLTARLYRESPQVLISRSNILQASRELVRPAPLDVEGNFRVSVPLIYPQEELFLNYGRISTAFIAAPGTISIDLNADSLFTAAVPFKFGGVNAQVNQQYARYKAFEASFPNKPDGQKLTRQIEGLSANNAYTILSRAYRAPLVAFTSQEKPLPLLTRWLTRDGAYNAATFLYDKANYEGDQLPVSLDDSLRPADDRLLTAARATAMNRFADYVTQRVSEPTTGRNNGLTVRTLATLLERYGRNLTDEERNRLEGYKAVNTAKASDLRFFDTLIKRNADTISRLANYEATLQRTRQTFDSVAADYIAAQLLAQALPGLTLDLAKLFYQYARPRLSTPELARSLEELYQLEVKDSVRIRAAVQALQKAGSSLSGTEISPGVFITQNVAASGLTLFDQIIQANRGKVIYVLLTSPGSEPGRQAALDAQRLRNQYRARDFALVYVPALTSTEDRLWPEISARYNLSGDHLLLDESQFPDIIGRLRPEAEISATVINRTGKIVKRNAPLPDAFEELRKVIEKNL